MIKFRNRTFYLQTERTSYWFQITDHGHLEHVYYGPKLPVQSAHALAWKRTSAYGSAIAYDQADPTYVLDNLPAEYATAGQGDYRAASLEVTLANGARGVDLTYASHRIVGSAEPPEGLPGAQAQPGDAETLIVTLADEAGGLELDLYYTIFAGSDVIVRRSAVRNTGEEAITVRALASSLVDLPAGDLQLVTFFGGWAKEAHKQAQPLLPGKYQHGSTTGSSSNRQNPGFILQSSTATEKSGPAYGFNLVYSGNHSGTVEVDSFGLVRVVQGINPQGFSWPLAPGEEFACPEATLCFSAAGLTGLSTEFHGFVQKHIQPPRYYRKPRPIVFNGWEAVGFNFDEKRQLQLAEEAARLGMELFVVDDGWFEGRADDTAGLGNFEVDRNKFPSGLDTFGQRIKKLGLEFGLWVEPEMVNADSNLYRHHPEWVLQEPGRQAKTGRNQYVLDLCNQEVRDFLVAAVGKVLDSAPVDYVKWDMNRHIADAYSPHVPDQGMVHHRYIQGLYEVLDRIFTPRPHIWLETCSSGGNRFDLGMLAYSAMIWASDNTDPVERLEIQGGLSHFYPLCSISAHVSYSPHQQTLRSTPLSTRFNVASFGALGYEYDLALLSADERREIRGQIKFYKKWRETFQFGRFFRLDTDRANLFQWQVGAGNAALVGNFQRHIDAAPGPDYLRVRDLDPNVVFQVTPRPQRLALERFGALVRHALPLRLDPRGMVMQTVNKHYSLPDGRESYRGTGGVFAQGVPLNMQFVGSYYNKETRLLGDYGSTIYVAEAMGPASKRVQKSKT